MLKPSPNRVYLQLRSSSYLFHHHHRSFSRLHTPHKSSLYYVNRALFITSLTSLSYISYIYLNHKFSSSSLPLSPFTFIRPFLFQMDAETAHKSAVKFAQLPKFIRNAFGMVYKNGIDQSTLNTNLECTVWDLTFPNPIGLAAGFDKGGECIDGMFDMGFGFVEIGSITPKPQLGNEKPRVWRLKKDKAVINRYGFNSDGHETVRRRLTKRLANNGKLGINLGKNKYVKQADAVKDYMAGIEIFTEFADYLVINISSPNTPGLRDLQRRDIIYKLLAQLKETRDKVHDENFKKSPMGTCENCKPPAPPLLVKIAPDLNDNEIEDIGSVVRDVGIDGIIVSNTTVSRDGLKTNGKVVEEYGGLSGKPVFERSNDVLKKMYKVTEGKVPLIGVGGIGSVDDAYRKIRCGASLVQLYTGMVYNGPSLIHEMIDRLDEVAKRDGFKHIAEAIGADC